MELKKKSICLKLFFISLYLSAFTFGGGYVIVTFMKKKYVEELGWIDEKEMLNLVAIAQSSPGAIAVNASILVGYKFAGFLGSIVSAIGTVIPPLVIISIISLNYTIIKENYAINLILDGMQIGVAVIILDVVINMTKNLIKLNRKLFLLELLVAFIFAFVFKVNIIVIILCSIVIGIIDTYIMLRNQPNI